MLASFCLATCLLSNLILSCVLLLLGFACRCILMLLTSYSLSSTASNLQSHPFPQTGSVETVAGIPDAHASIFDSATELFVSPQPEPPLLPHFESTASAAAAPQPLRTAASLSALNDSGHATAQTQQQPRSLSQAVSMPSLQSARCGDMRLLNPCPVMMVCFLPEFLDHLYLTFIMPCVL